MDPEHTTHVYTYIYLYICVRSTSLVIWESKHPKEWTPLFFDAAMQHWTGQSCDSCCNYESQASMYADDSLDT
jgi:hypothetical protein